MKWTTFFLRRFEKRKSLASGRRNGRLLGLRVRMSFKTRESGEKKAAHRRRAARLKARAFDYGA
jgi:hypothetical protein